MMCTSAALRVMHARMCCCTAGAAAGTHERQARKFNGGNKGNQHSCPVPGCTGQVFPNQTRCKVCNTDVKQLRKKNQEQKAAIKPRIKAATAVKRITDKALACSSRCPGLQVVMVIRRPGIKKPVYRGEHACAGSIPRWLCG